MFDSRRGLGIFLFTTTSRTALGPTQPLIQCVPGALSLGVKLLGREADNSPPSTAEVKECVELYLHSSNTSSWRGAYLSTGTTLPVVEQLSMPLSHFLGCLQCTDVFDPLMQTLFVVIRSQMREKGGCPISLMDFCAKNCLTAPCELDHCHGGESKVQTFFYPQLHVATSVFPYKFG
jgi:hypothetical protein